MFVFDRSLFYPKKLELNINKVLKVIKDLVIDKYLSANFSIMDISSIQNIRDFSILFLENDIDFNFENMLNVLIICDDRDFFYKNKDLNVILVDDSKKAYSLVVNEMYFHEDSLDFFDEFNLINNSLISKFSDVHSSSRIDNNCIIGRGVVIGKNCIIKNNVVIKNSILKDNIIVGDNTTLGSTGFGFSLNNMGSSNIYPHIGIVVIEDNVRIGSNCSIDRAKIDYTYIGSQCMLDNQIHIAHNVHLCKNACVAAQVGISGSTFIGNNAIIGGQSGFVGHIKVGKNVVVAAKSGVTKNINDNSKIAGFPATDINIWKKNIINERKNRYK